MQKAIIVDGKPKIIEVEEPKKESKGLGHDAEVKLVELTFNAAMAHVFESAEKSFGPDVASEAFISTLSDWLDLIKKSTDEDEDDNQ